MTGHNDLLEALEAEGATERERLDDAVQKAHTLMSGSYPAVVSPAVIGVNVAVPRPSTANTDVVGGTGFLGDPSAHGYPDATNTGVPAGTVLTSTGSLDVNANDVRENGVIRATRPGSWGPVTLLTDRTVISRAHISGLLRQRSDVLLDVNASRIEASGADTANYTVDTRGKLNWVTTLVTLTDCQVEGKLNRVAVGGGLVTAVRCDIAGGEDNLILGSATNLRDCHIHDLERKPGSHNDSFEHITGSGSSAVHCTILAARPSAPGVGVEYADGWYDPMNAVLMIGNSNGPVQNITIEDCLVDGGNYTFNNNWQSATNLVENITVRGCRFGRHFRFGPRSTQDAPSDPAPPTWIWEANVWDDTGEPV